MKHHPEIDRYAGLSSPIHNWDPRAKLIAILVLIVAIVLIPDLKIALIGLAIALALVFIPCWMNWLMSVGFRWGLLPPVTGDT